MRTIPAAASPYKTSRGGGSHLLHGLVQVLSSPERRGAFLGTQGRTCDPNSMGVGGCGILCCNRGYRSAKVVVVEVSVTADSSGVL